MSEPSFRFLHAADFQLDVPLHGMVEVPEPLREWMIDAPYAAAEQVFDTAIQERVSLVVLSGNLLDLEAPHPRSVSFLCRQFARLAQERIAVCWAGSCRESATLWPQALALPSGVHLFGGTTVDAVSLGDAVQFPLVIYGRSGDDRDEIRCTDFLAEAGGAFSIAITSGRGEASALSTRSIDYWALGGRNDRKTLFTEPRTAHYPGTPQGRRPTDVGPHGCTIVEVQATRQVRLRFVPCDVVRWQHERVLVSPTSSWDDLVAQLTERIQDLRSQTPANPLLVRWTLVAADVEVMSVTLREFAERAEKWLRKQFSTEPEPCWPVSIGVEVPDRITAASYKEDTLLGDYLRAIRQMQDNPKSPEWDRLADLAACEPGAQWVADLSQPGVRGEVLQEAAEMGAALLRGERIS
ncbi:MAG: metallophosphoesterase family protein [Pirellulaceae bacterium]